MKIAQESWPASNAIAVRSKRDICYNRCENKLNAKWEMMRMLKEANHGVPEWNFDSLEALVDAISETLQCPITIEDPNHSLLAFSSHEAQTDPVRIATIIGRKVPEKVVKALWRDGQDYGKVVHN